MESSIHNVRYTRLSSPLPYEGNEGEEWKALDDWARAGAIAENRVKAVELIREFAKAPDRTALELSNLQLREMPPLPASVCSRVVKLSLDDNRIEHFDFGDGRFHCLKKLNIDNNSAETISGSLPALVKLNAGNNSLTSASNLDCPTLEELDLRGNGEELFIDSLPVLPKLTHLYLHYSEGGKIDGNRLPNLVQINLNAVTDITFSGEFHHVARQSVDTSTIHYINPENFPKLETLRVEPDEDSDESSDRDSAAKNEVVSGLLTTLAERIPQFLKLTRLEIPAQWLQDFPALVSKIRESSQSRPKELEQLEIASTDDEPEGNLVKEVGYWCNKEVAARWYALQTNENATKFAGFLSQLKDNKEACSPTTRDGFRRRVEQLLGALENDAELRAKIFAMAAGERTDCMDRRAIAFADLEMAVFTHHMEKAAARKSDGISLVAQLHQLHRHRLLENFISGYVQDRKKKGDHGIDELDVYLAFRYRLAEALDLPVKIRAMDFEEVTGIDETHCAQAMETVRRDDASSEKFANFMATNEAWSIYLQTNHRKELDELIEQHLAKMDGSESPGAQKNVYTVAEHERKLKLAYQWLAANGNHHVLKSNLGKRAATASPHALQARLMGQLEDPRNDSARNRPRPSNPAEGTFTGFGGFQGFASHPIIDPASTGTGLGALPPHQSQRPMAASSSTRVNGLAGGESVSGLPLSEGLPVTDPGMAYQWLQDKLFDHPNGILIALVPGASIRGNACRQAEVLSTDGPGEYIPEDIKFTVRALDAQGKPVSEEDVPLVHLLAMWDQQGGCQAIQPVEPLDAFLDQLGKFR